MGDAAMDEAELRKQERALIRGIGICLLAFLAGMGLWAYNFIYTPRLHHLPAPPEAVKAPPLVKPAASPTPPPPILEKAASLPAQQDAPGPRPGLRYVHRDGSVLRDKPKPSGHILKKEIKGAKVILEALEQDGWAKVTDGALEGWMRASVLGIAPPE
jgi:hypothetical protein